MPKPRRISQSDELRAILTDLAPYEVPLRFSFTHVYIFFKQLDHWGHWVKKFFDSVLNQPVCEPYQYRIFTGEGKERCLGLISPLLLKDFAGLYEDYGPLMVSLCSRSGWSLRRPSKIAKRYIIKDKSALPTQPTESVDTGDLQLPELLDEIQNFSSSYFAYENFNLMAKFFESREWLLLERRFLKYRRIDLAKCFGNIYTHTISWAVKGRPWSKENIKIKRAFDSVFDLLMRKSNSNETHGILIGSEAARIFAEIILQSIDIRTENACTKAGLIEGKDYSVRRYIDDYFIFFNDSRDADLVESKLSRELAIFKLHINENKRTEYSRPFMTRLSVAKVKLSRLVGKEFKSPLIADEAIPAPSSDRFLVNLRMLFSQFDLKYSEVSAFILKHIQWRTSAIARHAGEASQLDESKLSTWLFVALKSAFFLLAVDTRFRTSTLMGRIISDVVAISKLPGQRWREQAGDLIMKESIAFLEIMAEGKGKVGIEVFNFLICLRDVDNFERIPVPTIEQLALKVKIEEDWLGYFATISLVYFCGDAAKYSSLANKLTREAVDRIKEFPNLINSTEMFCCSLDLLSCPHADGKSKRAIARKLFSEAKHGKLTNADADAAIQDFESRPWLFDWRSLIPTDAYLRKKELSLAY